MPDPGVSTVDLGWGEFPADRLRYMVRTCRRVDGRLESPYAEAAGFVWPHEPGAIVEAPDWRPDAKCGGGLHGLRAGQQDPGVWATGPGAVWLVVAYDVAEAVDLGGKTKVQRCRVDLVIDEADGAAAVVPLWLRARGVTEPVFRGVVTAGYRGTATAGYRGTATAGYRGTATAGEDGNATAGDGGTIIVAYYTDRLRLHVGYIGEDGLLPGVPYRVEVTDGVPRWVRADGGAA